MKLAFITIMSIRVDMKWNFKHKWQNKSIGYQNTQISCKTFQFNTSFTWLKIIVKEQREKARKEEYDLGTAILI